MSSTRPLLLVLVVTGATPAALGGQVPLIGYADGGSRFYEYSSEGFVQMDWTHPTQPTHQSYRNINDPSVLYGAAYDAFPNDNEFRMGLVEFDESGLVGGTGDAPITGLTFGVSLDPFDPDYVNWARFTTNTIINGFEGTVQLLDGSPTGVTLTVDVTLEMIDFYYATIPGYYDGEFTVSGNTFSLAVRDTQTLDIVWGTQPVELQWDFAGTLYNLPLGDYNADSAVDSADYARWAAAYGSNDLAADGNGDRLVDAADYTVWRDRLAANGAATVPEPAAMTLAALVIVAGGRSRGRG